MSDNDDGQVAAGAAGARSEVQVLDLVGHLLLERERQRRPQPCAPGGQVAGERRRLAGRHEHDDLAVADILDGFVQWPHDGRCAARARVVDRDPARGCGFIGAEPYDQKFRHRHVVPRLRRIGTTCPVAPRCSVLK